MKLYDSTGTILIGNLSDNIIECIVEEERNGLFELTLTYPASYDYSLDLIKENILVANANNILLNQKFRIYNIRKKYSNMIEICARHISYDLLDDFIENINIENQSCEYALNQIFKNSQFSKNYKGYSDIINSQNYKANMSNCLNAIVGQRGSIVDTFGTGAEILRENENIYVLNKRGHDNGVVIAYGDNMSGFTCEEDTADLITRIYPYIKNNEEGKEKIITLPEKFVDSPMITKYSHPYIKSIDFSDKFEQGEEFNLAKLKLEAEKYFIQNKCDIPKMTFNIDFVLIEKYHLSLCDIVTINHKIYNIITQSKIIKASFDVIKNRYKKMTLGDSKATLGNLIGGSSSIGPPGKDGIQGPPGKDGEEFPDVLPEVPILNSDLKGFASVDLTWTFENKVYYSYQLFASKIDSNPNAFDLIFEGQGSSFLHQVKPGETWFYWVRALNTHGKATGLSNKLIVNTKKEDDFENYFSSLAVKDLVVNMFSVDYMEAGIVKGHWIDAKQLSVTDGNGKRTLDIDSFGNVNLDVAEFKVRNEQIYNKKEVDGAVGAVQKNLTEYKQSSEDFQFKVERKGAYNLIRNGDFSNGSSLWQFNVQANHDMNNPWYSFDGSPCMLYYAEGKIGAGFYQTIENLEIGEKYTISVDLRVEGGQMYISAEGTGSTIYTSGVGRHHCTFLANRKDIPIVFYGNGCHNFYADNITVVKGEIGAIGFVANNKELYSGITKIDENGVNCNFDDGTKMRAGRGGFYYETGDGEWAYHALSLVGTIQIPSEETRTVTLPAVFRGKNFKVICTVSQIGNGNDAISNPKPLISFWAGSDQHNYANGTFRIYGSTRLRNDNGTVAYRDKIVEVSYTVVA